MKRIIRVFPRRTAATPDDELVRIADTPSMFDEADEVHISVAFTWDIPHAEWLAGQWSAVAPTLTCATGLQRTRRGLRAGFMPFAMLYRDQKGDYDKTWRRFQREWANHTIVSVNCKKYFGK